VKEEEKTLVTDYVLPILILVVALLLTLLFG